MLNKMLDNLQPNSLLDREKNVTKDVLKPTCDQGIFSKFDS